MVSVTTCARLGTNASAGLQPGATVTSLHAAHLPCSRRDAEAGNYSCAANREWGDAALWSFSLQRGWRRHRDLPLPLLHAAGCTVKLGQGGSWMCPACCCSSEGGLLAYASELRILACARLGGLLPAAWAACLWV